MRQSLTWFWQRGILSSFLAGLFALLPIVITVGIMAWAGSAQGMARSAKLRWAGTVSTGTSLCHRPDRGIGVYIHARFLILIGRGELVGLVTMDNVGEFVAVQAAEKGFAAAKRERIHVGSD